MKWFFEPSVAQPPLPLQSFFPLQPLALDLHPPWPLQSFLPLQECLSPSSIAALAIDTLPATALMAVLVEVIPEVWDAGAGAACNLAAVPPKRPDTAAVIIMFRTGCFIKVKSFRKTESRAAASSLPAWLCYMVRIVSTKVTAIISFLDCQSHILLRSGNRPAYSGQWRSIIEGNGVAVLPDP